MQQQVIFGLLVFSVLVGMMSAQSSNCAHIYATSLGEEDKRTLCKLYQNSAFLSQLSLSVTNSMDQFIAKQIAEADNGAYKPRFEKRKHEYLRFGRK
ncbi:FMRFamide-like peptide 14 [Aphelenchoides bicaudatus]|nr:FMRFamide-like peptide 14 [Aphelenchoides bicaudatus]